MNTIIRRIASFLPEHFVFGKSFEFAKKILVSYEESKDKVDFVNAFQEEKLKEILKLASKAPYYSYLTGNEISVNNLPFIDKDMVLKAFDKLIVTKSNADYVTTGGTSGKPLGFYINKNRKGFEWFWMTYNWSKVNFSRLDYRAVLRNHKLGNHSYLIDPLLREYQYNNFSLTGEYLEFILTHTNKLGIKFLHAYPSAAYILAKHLSSKGSKNSIKTFLCGSENIFDFQKQLIENNLGIRMYTWYGHSEKLILAGEGRDCSNYHSNPFYGYTEILDSNGNNIKTQGKTGELIGTGFLNTKMPFIRYRTGDYATFEGDICKNCGHVGLTFSNVKGRWQGDKIYKDDDSIITTTALNLHNDIYNYIKNVQYLQQEKGKLVVRVVPELHFNRNIKEKLMNELLLKVGSGLQIEIVEVEQVEYSSNNKFQLLIQKVNSGTI